jgi:hypothetical protein
MYIVYAYNYLLRCSFVASTDVMCPVVLLGMDWGSRLSNVGSIIIWDGGGGAG